MRPDAGHRRRSSPEDRPRPPSCVPLSTTAVHQVNARERGDGGVDHASHTPRPARATRRRAFADATSSCWQPDLAPSPPGDATPRHERRTGPARHRLAGLEAGARGGPAPDAPSGQQVDGCSKHASLPVVYSVIPNIPVILRMPASAAPTDHERHPVHQPTPAHEGLEDVGRSKRATSSPYWGPGEWAPRPRVGARSLSGMPAGCADLHRAGRTPPRRRPGRRSGPPARAGHGWPPRRPGAGGCPRTPWGAAGRRRRT